MELFNHGGGKKDKPTEQRQFRKNPLENANKKKAEENAQKASLLQAFKEAEFFKQLPAGGQAVIDMKAALEQYGGVARKKLLGVMKGQFYDERQEALAEAHIVALVAGHPGIVEFISSPDNEGRARQYIQTIAWLCLGSADCLEDEPKAMQEAVINRKSAELSRAALELFDSRHFARVADALKASTKELHVVLETITDLAETDVWKARGLLQYLAGLDVESMKEAVASAEELDLMISRKEMKKFMDEAKEKTLDKHENLMDLKGMSFAEQLEHIRNVTKLDARRMHDAFDEEAFEAALMAGLDQKLSSEELAQQMIEIGRFNKNVKKLGKSAENGSSNG